MTIADSTVLYLILYPSIGEGSRDFQHQSGEQGLKISPARTGMVIDDGLSWTGQSSYNSLTHELPGLTPGIDDAPSAQSWRYSEDIFT
jgi:hypothetical protein